jgi:hypothetical protein
MIILLKTFRYKFFKETTFSFLLMCVYLSVCLSVSIYLINCLLDMNIDTDTGADTNIDRSTYLRVSVLGHKVTLYLTFEKSVTALCPLIDRF